MILDYFGAKALNKNEIVQCKTCRFYQKCITSSMLCEDEDALVFWESFMKEKEWKKIKEEAARDKRIEE